MNATKLTPGKILDCSGKYQQHLQQYLSRAAGIDSDTVDKNVTARIVLLQISLINY